MYLTKSDSVPTNLIPKTVEAHIAVLSPKEEKDFIVRKIVLKSGGSMPNHTNLIQHQQYVLEGEAEVFVGGELYHAKAGDFIYIPAGAQHWYKASSGVDYVFLCMITTQEDCITLAE